MADLIIKPSIGTDNKLIIQDQAGNAVLTTDNSGVTLTNANLANANNVYPAGHVIQTSEVITGTTSTTIDADFLTVFDSNSYGAILPAVNLTAIITASGVNGLDTGSEAAIWYHIYVIYNGTTVASLLSASATSPTMPSGYTYKKYVGAVYNPSSAFRNFHQIGNAVSVPTIGVGSTITNTSYASLSVATVIPSTATQLWGAWNTTNSSTTGFFYLASDSAGLGEIYVRGSVSGALAVPYTSPILITPDTIYKKVSASTNAYLNISGYYFSNIV